MCSQNFLRAGVGIVVGAVPFDGAIFRYDFVAALAGDGHGADFAETAQTVIVLGMPRQREHFERAAQIHVQTTLFRLAIERGGAMNYGIRGVNEAIILIAAETETGRGQVPAKDTHLGLEIFKEARKFQMQLQGTPQAELRFLRITRSHEQVQGRAVAFQQIGRHVSADVSGGPGQEYRHVAPLVPVFTASPFAGAS